MNHQRGCWALIPESPLQEQCKFSTTELSLPSPGSHFSQLQTRAEFSWLTRVHTQSVPLYPVVLPGPTPAVAQSGRDRAQTEDCYQAMGSHRGDCQTAGLAPMQTAQCQGPITTPNRQGTDQRVQQASVIQECWKAKGQSYTDWDKRVTW